MEKTDGWMDFLNASGKLNIMFLIVSPPPHPLPQGIILIYKWYRIHAKCEKKHAKRSRC